MSDSVILRSVKKFGEENYGFESDGSRKWPFSLTISCTKGLEQASEVLRGRENQQSYVGSLLDMFLTHAWAFAPRIHVMECLKEPGKNTLIPSM